MKTIPVIYLGEGYVLKPILNNGGLKAFAEIVNDEGVYPTIRHGAKWDQETINKVYNGYIVGNIQFENEGYKDAEHFLVTWFLEHKSGEIIGRASLQVEDKKVPPMTNIAIAIKTLYQGRSLGKKSCKAMVDWFDAEINKPLRWLSVENNTASIKIALDLGFSPMLSDDGTQAFVEPWGKKYIIFERPAREDVF